MKRFAICFSILLWTNLHVLSQGQVNFITVIGPAGARTVDAPVQLPNGSGPGAAYAAQLFLYRDGAYTALTPATVFRSDFPAAAFYVVDPGMPVTVPGYPPLSTAPLVLRMWQKDAGSYDASPIRGESPVANIVLGGGILPPSNLVGLQGITVPEPSTILVGVIGAVVLLCSLQKKE
jgi:hypothetical protein